ncbi:MAG TPA: hypothetical protein VIW69_16595 [Candidatus Elarobacter sp.]
MPVTGEKSASAGPRPVAILTTLVCSVFAVAIALHVPAAASIFGETWALASRTPMPFAIAFTAIAIGAFGFLAGAVLIGWTCSTLVAYVAAPEDGKHATLRLQARTLWSLTALCVVAAIVSNGALAVGQRQVTESGLVVAAMHDINAMPRSEIRIVRDEIAGGRTSRTATDSARMANVKALYTSLPWSRRGEIEKFLDLAL